MARGLPGGTAVRAAGDRARPAGGWGPEAAAVGCRDGNRRTASGLAAGREGDVALQQLDEAASPAERQERKAG